MLGEAAKDVGVIVPIAPASAGKTSGSFCISYDIWLHLTLNFSVATDDEDGPPE